MPSVYIKTYGCQMNERDSEAVAAQLVAKGYTLAPSEHVADVVLLNTCSVRDLAEQKALNKMENVAAELRRGRPAAVLGFMGCLAQSRGGEAGGGLGRAGGATEGSDGDRSGDDRPPAQVTAFGSIMQGCNQYCTFCIVPYTRGRERSRTIPDIVSECRELVSRGVREITLLGQIVTSYGKHWR